MRLTGKKLLIFDLDGTLIDSGLDLAAALNDMLSQLGRENFEDETIHTWVGNGAKDLVLRALCAKRDIENESVDEELFLRALDIFLDSYKRNVCVKTTLYDGVKESLEILHQKGYLLSIVTNKPLAFVKPILEILKIERYFSIYLGADSLSEKKPSPLPLEFVMQKYKIPKTQTVMVGDSKNDIIAAHNAKIDVIGVGYGYNYGEDISLYNPTLKVESFEEILEVLDVL